MSRIGQQSALVCVEVSEKLLASPIRQLVWFSGFENSPLSPRARFVQPDETEPEDFLTRIGSLDYKGGKDMSRLEFIFSAVNAIASKKQGEAIEYLLVEAVYHEIENAKQERCATPAAGLQVISNGRGNQVQSLTPQTASDRI